MNAFPNPSLYPFASHHFATGAGRLHYLDEGKGQPLVMVHGTPTWSFLYRHFVRELSGGYRCIAPDHLGFGLSDKPEGWSYTPEAHAEGLAEFITSLGLKNIVLMVHDFGGPIGLSYALEHPDNVAAVVIFNTWMWSNAGNRPVERASRIVSSPFGRFLYRRLNLSPRVLLRSAFADGTKLTPEVHRHYLEPFPTPQSRQPLWVLARELTGSNAWYTHLWERREALRNKPALLLWGLRDSLIPETALAKWEEALPHARAVRFGSGHFVQEEAWEEALPHVRGFLHGLNRVDGPGDRVL